LAVVGEILGGREIAISLMWPDVVKVMSEVVDFGLQLDQPGR
jgi:hypothetical protein